MICSCVVLEEFFIKCLDFNLEKEKVIIFVPHTFFQWRTLGHCDSDYSIIFLKPVTENLLLTEEDNERYCFICQTKTLVDYRNKGLYEQIYPDWLRK